MKLRERVGCLINHEEGGVYAKRGLHIVELLRRRFRGDCFQLFNRGYRQGENDRRKHGYCNQNGQNNRGDTKKSGRALRSVGGAVGMMVMVRMEFHGYGYLPFPAVPMYIKHNDGSV